MNPSSRRLMMLLAEQAAETRWCSRGELEVFLLEGDILPEYLLERLSMIPDVAERILRLANSAAHAAEGPMTGLSDAVSHLGVETLRRLLFNVLLERLFPERGKEWFRFAPRWRHTLALAAGAATLAEVTGMRPHEVFVGALMADLGHLTLSRWGGPVYQRIEAASIEAGTSEALTKREEEILGFDHASLGAEIASRWELPSPVLSLIRDHHRLSALKEEIRPGLHLKRVAILHLAEELGTSLGFGMWGDVGAVSTSIRWERTLVTLEQEPAAAILSLSAAQLKSVKGRLEQRIPELVAMARGKEGTLFTSGSPPGAPKGAAFALLGRWPMWKQWLPPKRLTGPRGEVRAE